MAIVISGSGIDMGGNPVSNASQVDSVVINENGLSVATEQYVDGKMVLGTAVNATGTAIDFTGIPSWVKKITVMFNGVSTNGSSPLQVQLGDNDGIENTGYISTASYAASTGLTQTSSTSGLQLNHGTGHANTAHGFSTIVNLSLNTWVYSSVNIPATNAGTDQAAGSKTLSGTLDRIRVTTVNGTDTFDAGQISIIYEG